MRLRFLRAVPGRLRNRGPIQSQTGFIRAMGPARHQNRLGHVQLAIRLAPLLSVMIILFGGAVVLAGLQAFGYAPWFGIDTFPDARPLLALWGSSRFWHSLGLTLYYASLSTLLSLVLGVGLARALKRSFPCKAAFAYVYKLPLMIPYTVGIALAVLTFGNGGMASRLAAWAGFIADPAEFPQILRTHAGWGIIAVYVWKQTPFVTLSVYAVMVGIGREIEEAAAILGASDGTIFRRIELPLIMPGIVSSTLICFAFNVGAFEAPLILGGGFPDTLPVLAWRFFNDADTTLRLQGMATVLSIALVAGVILYLYLLAYRRFEKRIGRL